ncbi:hypothetical protein D3C84_321220 [compost metagenome]
MGADDRLHRRPAAVRHGGAEGLGAAARHPGGNGHVGGDHGALRADALALPAGAGHLAGHLHRRLHHDAQRLVLFLRARRLHRGDHRPARHRPSADGVRPGGGAQHGNQPRHSLRHSHQRAALAAAGGAPAGPPGTGRLAMRHPGGDHCAQGRTPGAPGPARCARAHRGSGCPARARLVRGQSRAPARHGAAHAQSRPAQPAAPGPWRGAAVAPVERGGGRAVATLAGRGGTGPGRARRAAAG